MQRVGMDISDPSKVLTEYHEAKKAERKEATMNRTAKRKADMRNDDACDATGKAKAKAKAKGKAKAKAKAKATTKHQERMPKGDKFAYKGHAYYYHVRKEHARSGKNTCVLQGQANHGEQAHPHPRMH